MKYQTWLPILVLAFTACMKIKNKDDLNKTAIQTEVQPTQAFTDSAKISVTDILVQYQGLSVPNSYRAVISWPKKIKGFFRLINASNTILETIGNSFKINNLQGGQPIKIILEQYSDSDSDQKRIAILEYTLLPPVDMVISEVLNLTEDSEYNIERLYLTSTAKIYTNQFNLRITARNIYSEFGAMISNYQDGATAMVERAGSSGGKTELFSDNASGNLQIISNAEKGGSGKYGWSEGILVMGEYIPVSVGGRNGELRPICPGNDGAQSGDGGSFFLTVNNAKDFIVSAHSSVIEGGLAGIINENCYFDSAYPELKNLCKSIGKPGVCTTNFIPQNGKAGKLGQICIKLNSEENYKCEKN